VVHGAEALPMGEGVAPLEEGGIMSDALKAINAQVAKTQKEEMAKVGTEALPQRGLSLDQEIEMAGELRWGKKKTAAAAHPDLGESASVSAEASKAKAKAGLADAIAAAQAAMKKAQSAQHVAEISPTEVDNAAIQAEVKDEKLGEDESSKDVGEDNEVDPVDAMMSQISSSTKQDLQNTVADDQDPLDAEIDQIAVVRKRLADTSKVRRALDEAHAQMARARGAIDMIEVEEAAEPTEKKADTTEKKADTTPAAEKSMPPPARAPPGPPLPKVKEVKKEIPQPAPLGRSTPEAADPAAALAAIKAAAAAAGNVLKRTPDDPLKHLPGGFTKEQVMTEIKALEAYPMTEEEATKEFQSKQIPYDQRTFKKDKVEIVKIPEKKPDPKANPLTAPPTKPNVKAAPAPPPAPPPAVAPAAAPAAA